MMRLRIFHIVFFCLIAWNVMGQSQIIDDSTKQVYGPYTTFYESFEDIKFNKYNLRKIDTLVGNLHRFDISQMHENKIQYLGNLGTATHPVFYTPPTQVGAQTGFNAYRPYFITANDVKYFDTKSPYTKVFAIFGGKGRSRTFVRHNRNITPYWNAGVYYQRISAQKQVASTGRGDRQSVSNAYHFHTHYQSKNGKYLGLGSISRINHVVEENGGIEIPEDGTIQDYFDENANVRLQNASSNAFRLGLHLYNEYKLRDEFQLYHSFEQAVEKNFYIDKPLSADREFYDQILISTDSTVDKAQFNELTNEVGVKGDLADMFYNFYVKFKNMKYIHQYLPTNDIFNENYGGFNLRYDFDSVQYIHAGGEYLIGGNYRLGGTYFMKFLALEYWRTRYKPYVIQETYFGNHHEWFNDFAPTASDFFKGSLTANFKGILISPFASLTNIKNNIYYDYDKSPSQATGSAQILNMGMAFNFRVGKIFMENEIIFSNISGDSIAANSFRIPKWFANSKLYFGSHFFDQKIYVSIGLDAHYKSSYYAPAYNPALQQFYLQDDFLLPSYIVIDGFIEFQIDHFTFFFKLTHANQPQLNGYFTFPEYIGQPRSLDLGIQWLFFN